MHFFSFIEWMKEAQDDWIDGSDPDPGQPAPAARGGGIPAGARGRPSHAGDSEPRAGGRRRALAASRLCQAPVRYNGRKKVIKRQTPTSIN